MTDHTPLTDEELASAKRMADRNNGLDLATSHLLIADLRASRAEVERLEAWKASLQFCPYCVGMLDPADSSTATHLSQCAGLVEVVDNLTAELEMAQAEVERLREQNERLKILGDQAFKGWIGGVLRREGLT